MGDVLPTIGEIAIVLTGFAGLIASIRPNFLNAGSLGNTRIRLLVSQTLLLLFLCFLPALFEKLDPNKFWIYSNFVMAIAIAVLNVWRLLANRNAPAHHKSSPFIVIPVLTAYVLLVVFIVSHLFGAYPGASEFIYLCGIYLLLTTSCLNFVILLFADASASDDGA